MPPKKGGGGLLMGWRKGMVLGPLMGGGKGKAIAWLGGKGKVPGGGGHIRPERQRAKDKYKILGNEIFTPGNSG